MATQKFENAPYYDLQDGGVFDNRVNPETLFGDDTPTPEYSFNELLLPLQSNDKFSSIEPRRSKRLVNGVTQIRYSGLDGEYNSGYMELVQIDTPDQQRLAAINSWSFVNDTGLPMDGCSWTCEFDDVVSAREFWEKYWRRNFGIDNIREPLSDFMGDHPEVTKDEIRLYEVGLLKPWFYQAPTDQRLLDSYSTFGESLTQAPKTIEVAATFIVGQVYKVGRCEWYTTKPSEYAAKTCLGAYAIKSQQGGWGQEPVDATLIQWDDGRLNKYYNEGTGNAPSPEPLTVQDLTRKPRLQPVS